MPSGCERKSNHCRLLPGEHSAVLERYTEYDKLAWFYDRYWGREYPQRVLPILEHLLLTRLPRNACILDLCCGVGHLTKLLVERGYRLVGLDGSAEMLRCACENVPAAEFVLADARSFSFPYSFDAVVSTFESLNHVMSMEEMAQVFRNVHAALKNGAHFVFDVLMEEAYQSNWGKSSAIVEEDDVCILQGGYDADRRVGRAEITLFRNEGEWRRSDVRILQRCYELGEWLRALEETGFSEISSYDVRRRLGMPGDLGVGRVFFVAKKHNTYIWGADDSISAHSSHGQ